MLEICVFVSGRGSNLLSILKSVDQGQINVSVRCVISDKSDCPAFEIAKEYNIETYSVSFNRRDNFLTYSELLDKLINLKIELIVLAGFLKKIPDEYIDSFPNRIINIHPALLPSFGGTGMYGNNVHKAVFDKSCKVSGATVHFVDKIYDNGKIIAQQCVDISNVKSPEEIAERTLRIEHKLLPFVVGKFAEGKVSIENNRVIILDK